MTCSFFNFESKFKIINSHDTYLKIDECIKHHHHKHSINEVD